MKIKSEKQSSKLCEPTTESYCRPLQFDPEKYRKHLPENDWSEEVRDEYLNTPWNMMSAFVGLTGGTDCVQAVSKTESPSSPENCRPVAQGVSNPHKSRNSIHPLARILKVPELRARALCGPSIEAAFIAHAMDRVTNARSLSRDIGVSYAAAHAAVE
jgi:hypothetical protein